MTTHDVFFLLAGLVTAGAAIRAVTTSYLLHAALWLVVALGALSGCYLVLGAELVALVQLIVYVGAVVVLVIFAMMVTRSPTGRTTAHNTSAATRWAGFVLAAGTGGLVGAVLVSAYAGKVAVQSAGTSALGGELFGTWVWPFELLSLLLLVALVAALAMSRLGVGDADSESIR
ncbi:NADH-quinone oxidoreductase subunit J family protein [Demetria terragena]|uniref:NADH-quinone oxidoreductase subunit J family protein n=1 Tax=Demetria terragena TaxID=63959 RepID=UPI00037E1427|nr:NADH-quinone oxidoreductase subunit J [Demetria terragena]